LDSVVKNSIVYEETHIENQIIADSMIGKNVVLIGKSRELSIGDFTTEIL
jgi:hypothetical protein